MPVGPSMTAITTTFLLLLLLLLFYFFTFTTFLESMNLVFCLKMKLFELESTNLVFCLKMKRWDEVLVRER